MTIEEYERENATLRQQAQMLTKSYCAWREAIEAEVDTETAVRIWRRALTIQGKAIPELPPSSAQSLDVGALPFGAGEG